jgi:hypothetical protein
LIAVRFSIIALALFAVAGCKASSQLGEECVMVKRNPNVDGGRLFVTNRELEAGAGKDFLSFGSTDCEDFICVRDSDYARPDGGALNPNEPAKGYCSRSCSIGDGCPSFSAELDRNPSTRMTCRALLLDADTLRALCNGSAADRANCTAHFANTTSSDFCARGGSGTDAGS